MRTVFSSPIRTSASASILVFLAALSVGVWMLLWDPVASNAAAASPTGVDLGQVTAKLEALHQRAAARQGDDDDDKGQSASAHTITPEKAASLAQQLAPARGDATTSASYIEIQTRNSRPVYAVRTGTGSVLFVDADTGAVGR